MKKAFVFAVLISFVLPLDIFAQGRVLGYPENYVRPKNPYARGQEATFISGQTQARKKDNRAWWVVVDRSNVKAYQNSTGETVQNGVNFGETYFVKEIKNGRAYLVKATVDKLKIKNLKEEVGWVEVDDLLLWNEGLINGRTQINLKALLLNQLDELRDIPCEEGKESLVQVYKSPTGTDKKNIVKIYKFYFVYKIEGARYLLGELPNLSSYEEDAGLLGWVDMGRVAEWNTRVALEPNFTQEGYSERKVNSKLEVMGYHGYLEAEEAYEEGNNMKKAFWSRDPVNAKKDVLSREDNKRFKGDLMRFPLLSQDDPNAEALVSPNVFKSAVLDNVIVDIECVDGKVVYTKQAVTAGKPKNPLEEELSKYKVSGENFKVFFLVEAGEDMNKYKESIANLIESVAASINSGFPSAKGKIKFGATIYKDIGDDKNVSNLVNSMEPSFDRNEFKNFILGTDFNNIGNGLSPVQNLAIKKAFQVAQFDPYESNLVILIGSKGDYSHDRIMKRIMKGSLANVIQNDINDEINKSNVNIIAIQCTSQGLNANKAFARNLRGLMLEAARKNHNRLYANLATDQRENFESLGISTDAPEMADSDEMTEAAVISLNNSGIHGEVLNMVNEEEELPPEIVGAFLAERMDAFVAERAKFNEDLSRLMSSDFNGEGYGPQIGDILAKQFQNSDNTGTDNVKDLIRKEYELFDIVYFPRKVSGAAHELFSYVLFWPENDLRNYYNFLENNMPAFSNMRNYKDKREGLKNVYCKMLDEFTGGELKKNCLDYSIGEVNRISQGVKAEGVKFKFEDIRIGELLDSRITPDEKIDELILRQVKSKNVLRKINQGEFGDFSFKRSTEEFFWIKVDDVF